LDTAASKTELATAPPESTAKHTAVSSFSLKILPNLDFRDFDVMDPVVLGCPALS